MTRVTRPTKVNASDFRIWEVHVKFYSIRGRKFSYTRRKLKRAILEKLSIRTSKYLSDTRLGINSLAAFRNEASSQIQSLLNTVDISSYEGYTYGMEVSMVVTDLSDGGKVDIPLLKVFYRDFKSLVRDRGLLGRDHSWLTRACEMAQERQVPL